MLEVMKKLHLTGSMLLSIGSFMSQTELKKYGGLCGNFFFPVGLDRILPKKSVSSHGERKKENLQVLLDRGLWLLR